MPYGVTVAHQILVLYVQVRILMGQQIYVKMNKNATYYKIFITIVLWLSFPFALANYIVSNKRKTIVFGICLFIVVFICVWAVRARFRAEMPPVVDVTSAFNTNNKNKAIKYVVIHHTGGNINGTINDIVNVHFRENKGHEIGYHYFIDSNGTIYQLRSLNESVPHALGYNDNSIAICINGNFEDYEPNSAQWQSALQLVRAILKHYGLDETAVKKHNELPNNATKCCGAKFDIEKFKNEL